jgi:intein/homing endonuclease/uncharacterized protein YeeX (DUF496 family)
MPSVSLFGWEFKRKDPNKEQLPSFTPQETNDGAVLISAGSGYGTYVDLDGTVRTEAELVTKYREMSLHPECDAAIDEIVNESIAIEDKKIVSINLENVKIISDKLESAIKEEFQNCLKLLDFSSHAYDIYRRWYIDGRLYFHVLIDKNSPQEGIKELRYVDPRKIRKIREISKRRTDSNHPGDAVVSQTVNEYYIFNDKGFNYGNKVVGPSTTGLKIAKDTILHVVSGLTDNQGTMVLSYLHKCLPKNTRIRTPDGWKYLEHIEKGDEVYSYNVEDNSFEKSNVIDKWASGIKPIISIRTRHTKFDCSYEHKVLVKNNKTNKIEYIEAQNLFPKVHQVKLAHNYDKQFGKEIEFPISKRNVVCKIKNPEVWVKSNILHKKKIIRDIANELDIKFSKVYSFIYGYGVLSETSAQNIINRLPMKLDLNKKLEGMCSNKLNIPQYIDERFARLFGFLLGDGCVNKYTVSFAEGIDKSQNIFYCNLMRDFFGNCERINSTGRIFSSWYTSNTLAAELLKNLDFITGAKNKRIPSWVFRAETFIQYAFMQGFMDADGCYDDTDMDEEKTLSCRINLSNEELIYDIKELWTLLGYSSGKVTKHKINSFGKSFIGYNIYLSKRLLPEWENIIKISGKEDEEVFDITVDHPSHNFIANHMVCSNSIKCLNQLRTLEDALVIYRLSRAPERRIWYIDVGNLPKIKAEQYLREIMVRHRNRLIYDAQSGEVKDDRKFMTMMEDYWLPRREGGKGTEVITLPGGQTLGQMDDVLYFQKKFLNALNVPISRLNSDALDMGGTATGITRDELKFQKFVIRLRIKFTCLFTELLKKQLVLKGIMSIDEWEQISADIKFDYAKDNYFDELKKAEIAQNRINLASAFQPMADKYYPHKWIRKEVLQQTDDEIKEFDREIQKEISSNDPRWINPEILQNESMGDQLFNQKLGDMQAHAMGQIPGQVDGQSNEVNKAGEETQGKSSGSQPTNAQQPQQPQQGQGQPQHPNLEEPLKQAIEFIKSMKEKGKANRSMQDESKYKQAIQLVSQTKRNSE